MQHLQVVFPQVVKSEAFGSALALIIAAALSDRVDITPVALCLRMLKGITIHLNTVIPLNGENCLEKQAKKVDGQGTLLHD